MRGSAIEAVKAVRYARRVANWTEVAAAAWRGAELTRLDLRGGPTLEGAPGMRLLGLFKEVCYRDSYRLRSEPLPPRATVVDVGANVGVFALHAMAVGAPARVLCYEPSAECFAVLRRNIERNRLDRIEAFPLGVAGRRGPRVLHVGACRGWNTMYPRPGWETVAIECITLADVFERQGVGRCDLLKLDCEGAEYEILLEAPDTVLARVDRAVVEFHDHLTEHRHGELVGRLRDAGLDVEVSGGPTTGYLFARRGGPQPPVQTRSTT